jgi:hypothetical protein
MNVNSENNNKSIQSAGNPRSSETIRQLSNKHSHWFGPCLQVLLMVMAN